MNSDFAILFDMNGVVIDDMKYHLEAWQEFTAKRGKTISSEEFDKMLAGRTNLETIKYLVKEDVTPEEAYILSEEKEEIYRRIYAPHLALLPGLQDFINDLKEHNVLIAVATAAPKKNVDLVMDGLNIRHLFDAIVDATQVEHGKPAPDIFLKAAQELNVDPKKCFVFEDSFLGLEAAHRANMKAIGVTTAHIGKELPYTILAIPDFIGMTYQRMVELNS